VCLPTKVAPFMPSNIYIAWEDQNRTGLLKIFFLPTRQNQRFAVNSSMNTTFRQGWLSMIGCFWGLFRCELIRGK
jgi:hypothetical protein